MIGIEINYMNKDNYIDSDGPFFNLKELNIEALKNFIKEGNNIEISTNQYLGTKKDYEFNDCYRRTIIKTIDDLDDFINEYK